MIAVFGRLRQFQDYCAMPRREFIFIETKEDLMGLRFTGVMWSGYFTVPQNEAFELLKKRQPEIFEFMPGFTKT